MESIHPAQFDEWLQSAAQQAPGVTPVVLDVREVWETQMAAIKADGFDLVHMPMHTVPARAMELDRNRPIACLCHHGARSAQVAYFLDRNGYTAVVNLAGGINAWAQHRDPSVPRY